MTDIMRKPIKRPDVKSWRQILDEYADLCEPPKQEEEREK